MLIDSIFRRSSENPANPISFEDFGYGSDTGEVITRAKSLRLAPYYRALDLISGDIAKLPLMTYARKSAGKERATSHQAYHLLRYKANSQMTAYNFKRSLAYQALCGNGYAHIVRRNGRVVELILLDSSRVSPVTINGALWYVYETGGGATMRFEHSEILHIHGLGWDGTCGHDARKIMSEAIASGLAIRKYGSKYFANNARPSVILQHPSSFKNKDAVDRLLTGWERMTKGLDNAHRAVVLEEGMTANVIGVNAKDSQLVEAATFNLIDVALFFGIPPHKLGHDGKTSYSSLEQENQAYLDQCLDHWLVQFEQECRDKLLTERQKAADSHVIEFNREALLEADMASKAESIQKALGGAAWMSVDEARSKFNMGAMGGRFSDIILPANNFPDPAAEPDDPDRDEENRSAIIAHAEALLRSTLQRMARRLSGDACRESKTRERMIAWLEGYQDNHRHVIIEAIRPICDLLRATGDTRTAEDHANDLLDLYQRLWPRLDIPGEVCEIVKRVTATIEKEFAQ